MTLLKQHREDYTKLKKKDLHKIIEEQLTLNRQRIDRNVYNPLNSKRNNARRALRKFWGERNKDIVRRARVKKHLAILKQIRNEGGL